jgi:molecular chaperone HscB
MHTPDFFQLFDIPVTLKIDPADLRSRFLILSREFHPDFYTRADESARAEALEKSAQLNRAWKLFQDPDAILRYVLMSKGLMAEEEKYELPQDFLMEVLEINEAVMDAEEKDPVLLKRIDEIQKEIYDPVKEIIEGYRETVHTEKDLLRVKDYYYKKKYLDRLRRELA